MLHGPAKRSFLLPLLAFILLGAPAQGQQAKRDVTLDDWLKKGVFRQNYVDGFAWMQDDRFYSSYEEDRIYKNALEGEVAPEALVEMANVKDPVTGEAIDALEYHFSPDEQQVLFLTNTERVYRHSRKHVAYLYDIAKGTTQRVMAGKPVSNVTFSADGSWLGFTHANDLYLQEAATGSVTRITDDGAWGEIINGSTDWVYEEEFGFPEGFYFSPDGGRVAYYRFDESKVPTFTMDYYTELYPERYTFKYPKAGERNANVQIIVYDIAAGSKTEMQINANPEQYIPAVRWTAKGDQLAILRMNRHQNDMEILLADPATGAVKTLLRETSETYIELMGNVTERLSNLQFLQDGKHFVYLSEKSGYAHLYLHDMEGKELLALTSGNWDVTSLYGIDEARGLVYYQSAEAGPLERHVYTINLKGKKKLLLTPGAGIHDAEFSSGYNYFVDYASSVAEPTRVSLHEAGGKLLRILEDNAELSERLQAFNLSSTEFFRFAGPSGDTLNGWMKKPANFDAKRRYPVLMYVYGGPGSQTVQNKWNLNAYFETLCAKGYIVVSVDGRGTGARGVQFKKCTYLQLGKYETEDQIAGANYLATLPYVDRARIGIWGWSYGGYMTLNCLAHGADVFKTGVAVAPVTNWRFYDTIYTERYMRTPQENPKGYDDNSPISHADKIQDRFLLIHGTGDDNVHYQNSIMMVESLVQANVQFELFFYPNKNHGIYGGNTTYHLYSQMLRFIEQNL